MKPAALMLHVDNPAAGFNWYQKAFPEASRITFPDSDIYALQVGEFIIEIVQSDEKVSSGMAGAVLYWAVDNLQVSIEDFKGLGSIVYRGPMQIEQGMGMCQVTDTFGNLIGLRGPYVKLSGRCIIT